MSFPVLTFECSAMYILYKQCIRQDINVKIKLHHLKIIIIIKTLQKIYICNSGGITMLNE